jgi:hypothetical protein
MAGFTDNIDGAHVCLYFFFLSLKGEDGDGTKNQNILSGQNKHFVNLSVLHLNTLTAVVIGSIMSGNITIFKLSRNDNLTCQ